MRISSRRFLSPPTVVPEAGAVQHGAEEVQSRQQEGSGPVRQLLGAEGEVDQAPGGAGPRPQIHHGAHERPGAAQVRGHPAHLQTGAWLDRTVPSVRGDGGGGGVHALTSRSSRNGLFPSASERVFDV